MTPNYHSSTSLQVEISTWFSALKQITILYAWGVRARDSSSRTELVDLMDRRAREAAAPALSALAAWGIWAAWTSDPTPFMSFKTS